ncbi:hypothetical protein [Pseudogemmobacter humi]|uniref:Uncharacterized protein n=1 Tax=Pseudogemmobacter humi TaxID=2483812 RepID=A0A3P5XMD2_9RHOB|nr:hypothetical protein [Pseudogemmobacter humi]VDC31426.1 hypothetical protein XINFAN_02886 [Pseudogemmobacter humi]
MSNLPELKYRIGADPSGVEKGGARAKRSIQDVDASFADMAKRAAKFGAQLGAAWATFKTAALAAGVAAAKTAVEIDNLSRVSNTNTTEFQKWAIAAKTVGVEQDKLADILKDVTDRVGEFLSTGGGPMKDFFENIAPKVGVTAEQFARLSGPEALQLYVSSLEKAGLSQQQMTFYLEAMSGDLTKMLPLLRNGGSEIKKLGDAAQATGKIIDKDMIRGGVELDRVFGEIADTLRTSATKAVLEHKDELIAMARWIADVVIPAISDLFDWIGKTAARLQPAIEAWARLGGVIAAALDLDEGPIVPGEKPNTPGDIAAGREGGDTSSTGTRPLDENGNVILDDGTTLPTYVPPPVVPGAGTGGRSSRGGGGGGRAGGTDREFDRIRERYMTETELLDEHLRAQLEKLAEFREKKLAGEEELAALEQQIREDHRTKMRAIDQAAIQERLAAWSRAFGDLSALMISENKKLFSIGKAAAVAQAIVDGWSAATSAYKKGVEIGGPPVGAAFAAMSLARTGAMLAQIRSAQIGGGSAMGGGGAGTGGSATAPVLPVQRLDIFAQGPADFMRGMEAMVQMLSDAAARGYRVDPRLVRQ